MSGASSGSYIRGWADAVQFLRNYADREPKDRDCLNKAANMLDTNSAVALIRDEQIRCIADICGEFSAGGLGAYTFSASYLTPENKCETVVIEPHKVQGIFEAIWLALKARPEYAPLEKCRREREEWMQRALDAEAKLKRPLDVHMTVEGKGGPG